MLHHCHLFSQSESVHLPMLFITLLQFHTDFLTTGKAFFLSQFLTYINYCAFHSNFLISWLVFAYIFKKLRMIAIIVTIYFSLIWQSASCVSLNFFDFLGKEHERGEKSLHEASFSTEIQQRSHFHPELFPYIGFVSRFLECCFSALTESNCRHLTTCIKGCCAFKWEMKACDFKHIKASNAGTLEKVTEDLPAQYYLYCLG